MPTAQKSTLVLTTFPDRLGFAMERRKWKDTTLAKRVTRHLAAKGEPEVWYTSRITGYRAGRDPSTPAMGLLATVLGVSVGWLHSGSGPMEPAQNRPPDELRNELDDYLAAIVRDGVFQSASDLYPGLEPQHIVIDARALLAEFVEFAAERFNENAERAVAFELRVASDEGYAEVVDAFVNAVPYSSRADAREAAHTLAENARGAKIDRPGAIHLSAAAIPMVRPAQQVEGTPEAVNQLQAIAEELRKAVASA